MSTQFITLSSNAAAIASRLDAFPVAMLTAIAAALDQENELTVGHVQQSKLSKRGPLTLGVITNRLRSSVRPAKAVVSGQDVISSIGSNVRYAGPHEDGFSGTVNVPEYSRRVKSRDVFSAAAAAEFDPKTGKITKRKRRTRLAVGVGRVRAHTMKMNIKARHYLANGIAERSGQYSNAVSEAIIFAWEHGGTGARIARASDNVDSGGDNGGGDS